MEITTIEYLGAILFGFAVLHTFVAGKILNYSHHFSKDSFKYYLFHLLGEIEVVFALWASLLMLFFIGIEGWKPAIEYQQGLNFIEPFFVFVIMVVCSTRPILNVARDFISVCSLFLRKIFRTPQAATDLFVILLVGSLSGSFITEPAAMTVSALLINSMLKNNSSKFLYALLAVLFVNVSIGGALTPFAAPPILMVAQTWAWDFNYVFMNFGWKSAIAVTVNSLFLVVFFAKEINASLFTLDNVNERMQSSGHGKIPVGITLVHLLLLVGIVITGHYQNAFMGLFLLFLGVASVTRRYQDSLRLKESLLVATFLGGIIVFGAFQKWWLAPLLSKMSETVLFFGAVGLTAITDNAALTYLGSQVPTLVETSRYALVAGAIVGGGLTIIANAPNAAGYSILSSKFEGGLNPVKLLVAALLPTAVAISALYLL